MNVVLPPALEKFARARVDSGLYSNTSEVIHEALRLLMDYEHRKDQLKEEVALGFAQLNDGHFCSVADEEEWLSIARNGR